MLAPINVSDSRFVQNKLTVKPASLTSGPKLLLNGTVQSRSKGRYLVQDDAGKATVIKLKYNLLDPIPTLIIDGTLILLAPTLKWYEYTWAALPGGILLIIGGAIGGALGGFSAYYGCHVFRSDYPTAKKYTLSALASIAAWIACFAVIVVLSILFPGLFTRSVPA